MRSGTSATGVTRTGAAVVPGRGAGHYPDLGNANGNWYQPIQYGEFAHVACYNTGTPKADPGVRDFWGHSIDRFAEKFRTTSGVVGGAIWAATDEVFNLTSGPVGYGEWGVIDLWRRPKPEFWLTKKAFSPVRLADGVLEGLTPGAAIPVPVRDWYDHTDLGELTVTWRIGTRSGTLTDVRVPARRAGNPTVPAGAWSSGDSLQLTFRRGSTLVDDYRLWLNTRKAPPLTAPGGATSAVKETPDTITVSGVDTPFTVVFDRWTARLTEATAGGEKVLGGGPDLVLSRAVPGRWARTSATVTTTGGQAVVTLTGRFGTLNTTIDVSPDIVYTGAWTHADISAGYTVGDLFGTESFTDAAGAAAELAFTGTGVGPTRPWRRTWAS